MIITTDERIADLLRGAAIPGARSADLPALQDAVHALNAASTLEDRCMSGGARSASSSIVGAAITSMSAAHIGSTLNGDHMTRSMSASSASAARRSDRLSGAEPITPGRFLREKVLAPDGLTQDQLARAMGVSRLTVNEIANDRRTITAEMALRLEAVTRVSAAMWLNLQRMVDLHRARATLAGILPGLRPITAKREFEEAVGEPELEDF
jgi:addiction module HigA family antidote